VWLQQAQKINSRLQARHRFQEGALNYLLDIWFKGCIRPPMSQKPTHFTCARCGKVKEYNRFRTKEGKLLGYNRKTRFCSQECGWKGRKWRPINEEGHVHSSGYRRLHFRGGKKAYQHRVLMAEALGRPLETHENVHHKDGDRLNNSLDNLELWTEKQPPGQRVIDKVAFAIEILTLYPEFAEAAGVRLVHITAGSPALPAASD